VASLVETHLRPMKSSRSLMRQRDLEAQYKDRIAADPDKDRYRGYLEDFKKIQALLHNVPKVSEYLRALSTPEARGNVDASLSREEGAWAASKPILLANTAAFTTVLNKGQMFVDTVAPAHGVHAHRLQWYVIARDIAKEGGYNHSAVELFRESSRVWWRQYTDPKFNTPVTKGYYMWEQILDRTGDMETTAFTTPDNLTKFIVEAGGDPNLAHLSEGIKAAEKSRRDLRNEHIERYAASTHFNQLHEWAKGDQQQIAVRRDDKIVVDGWTYTGFLPRAWMTPPANIKEKLADTPEQPVPTLVYPPGHDPEARPA